MKNLFCFKEEAAACRSSDPINKAKQNRSQGLTARARVGSGSGSGSRSGSFGHFWDSGAGAFGHFWEWLI